MSTSPTRNMSCTGCATCPCATHTAMAGVLRDARKVAGDPYKAPEIRAAAASYVQKASGQMAGRWYGDQAIALSYGPNSMTVGNWPIPGTASDPTLLPSPNMVSGIRAGIPVQRPPMSMQSTGPSLGISSFETRIRPLTFGGNRQAHHQMMSRAEEAAMARAQMQRGQWPSTGMSGTAMMGSTDDGTGPSTGSKIALGLAIFAAGYVLGAGKVG